MSNCPLSPRELEFIQHAATGIPVKAISFKMNITLSTANKYAQYVMIKIDRGNMVGCVAHAIRNGWIE